VAVQTPSRDRRHVVTVVVEGKQIEGWLSYEIQSSMIEPADTFTLTRPWDAQAWEALPRDARVQVVIDGVTIIDGFVDDRRKQTKAGTFTLTGRDRAGRLVQESAPSHAYGGVDMLDAVKRLATPWYDKVSTSDARNRNLRRGKGRRLPSGNEPIVVRSKTPFRGRVQPGQTRWVAIEEIVTQAGYLCWSSADGRELIVGKPNYQQAPQYLLYHALPGGTTKSTVLDLDYLESNGDRFSMIAVVGGGGGSAVDYGEAVSSRAGVVFDNPANLVDGTGLDFKEPKRLLMPEHNLDANNDASRVAEREQARRDFKRVAATVEMDQHGQWIGTGAPTIFAPNTVARLVDEDFDPPLDQLFLIYACTYRCDRGDGQTTMLELVPAGTEIVL
jgi:prophage tail gpP-like protein